MEDFDPYYIWLGIPPEEQPPDHYRLLGVRRFEQNADVIANAAEGKMAYLRTLQVGKRSKQSQALLNEIAAAQACLLNAKSRAAYDAKIRAVDAARTAHPAATPIPSINPLPLVPLAPLPAARVQNTTTQIPAPLPVAGIHPVAASPMALPEPAFPLSFQPPPKAVFHSPPAGTWQQIQAKLESLPRAAVIALGVGPVVVALLLLVVVIVATSGGPAPDPNRLMAQNPSIATAANFKSETPTIVPPQPIPPPPPSSPPDVRPIENQRRPPSMAPPMHGPPPQLRIDATGAEIHRAVLASRGDFVALDVTSQGKRRVQVFEIRSGRKLMAVDGPALAGRLAMAGELLLVATEPQRLAAFEAVSGRLRFLKQINGNILDLALSPDGNSVFVLTADELLTSNAANFESSQNLLGQSRQHGYTQLHVQPNVVMAVGDHGLEAYQIDTKHPAARVQYDSPGAWRAFLPDDQSYFRLYEQDGRLHYERQGLNDRGRFAASQLPPGAPPVSQIVAGAQGGNLIAWFGPGRELTFFDLVMVRPVGRIMPSETELSNFTMSPSGEWIGAREGSGPFLVLAASPVVRTPMPLAWPNQQRLQQQGGGAALVSASVVGPALKNVGVSGAVRNGTASSPPNTRPSTPSPPSSAPSVPSNRPPAAATPERIAEAMAAIRAAGLRPNTADGASLNHLQLSQINDDRLAEHLAVLPRLTTVIVDDNCEVSARFFTALQSSSITDLHLPATVDDSWLAEIAGMQSLKALHLRRYDSSRRGGFTRAGLERLSTMPQLQTLELSGDLRPDLLFALPQLPMLKNLTWSGNQPVPSGAAGQLAALRGLTSLNVNSAVDDSFISELAESSPDLGSLHAENSQLTDKGLEALGRLTKLNHLGLSGDFSPEGLRNLKSLEQLQYVRWHRTSVSASHIDILASHPQLHGIFFAESLLQQGAVDSLCKLKQLQVLQLQRTYVSADELSQLKQAIANVHAYDIPARPLRKPRVVSPAEREALAEAVNRLRSVGVHLSLNGQGEVVHVHLPQDLTDENASRLALLTTVQNVNLPQSSLRPGPVLTALKNASDIQSLSVPYSIDDGCLAAIAEMGSLTNLTIMSPARSEQSVRRPFTSVGLAKLSALPLTSLTIQGKLDGKDMKALLQCKQLTRLHWNTSDSPPNLLLGQLKELTALEELSLGCDGGDGTVKTVVDALPKLKQLSLQGNLQLTDRSLRHIASLGELQRLTINGDFTVVGFKSIAELKNLEYLNVHRSKLTKAAIEQLGSAENLRQLHFNQTKFDAGAVKALAGLKDLQSLWIHESGISPEDAAVLKQVNDNYRIYQNGRQL